MRCRIQRIASQLEHAIVHAQAKRPHQGHLHAAAGVEQKTRVLRDASRNSAQAAAVFTCITGFILPSNGPWRTRVRPWLYNDCSGETTLLRRARGPIADRAQPYAVERAAAVAPSQDRTPPPVD